MRIHRDELPVRIEAPGAIARQETGFGDAANFGTLGAEYFSFAEGADITELLHGLEGDMCQSPHWGYLVEGSLTTMYGDGREEKVQTGDLFYWPPGHSVRADADTDFVMFSPQEEHGEVMGHIQRKLDR